MKKILLLILLLPYFSNISKAQDYIWANKTGIDIEGLVVDNIQNTYIACTYQDSILIDTSYYLPLNQPNYNREHSLLAKYNVRGELIDVFQHSGTGSLRIMDIEIDRQNNIYVQGRFGGSITIGTNTIYADSAIGSNVIFKIDTSFNVQWIQTFKNSLPQVPNIIYVDAIAADYDSLFIIGNLFGTYTIGATTISDTVGEQFIANLNTTNGQLTWIRQFDRNLGALVNGLDISADKFNNVILKGQFSGHNGSQINQVIFNLTDTLDLATNISVNGFCAKFDKNGNYKWAKQVDSTYDYHNHLHSMAIDTGANIYLGSAYQICKYDSNGVLLWSKRIGGSCYGLSAIDEDSYAQIFYKDSLWYDSSLLKANPGRNYSLLKLDGTNGNVNWVCPEDIKVGNFVELRTSKNGMIHHAAVVSDNHFLGGNTLENGGDTYGLFAMLLDSTFNDPSNNKITGKIFNDINNNCLSLGDPGLNNFGVIAQPGNYLAAADANGNYEIKAAPGQYTVTQITPNSHGFINTPMCQPFSYSVNLVGTNQVASGNDFANQYVPCYFLNTRALSTQWEDKCDSHHEYFVEVCNYGEATAQNVNLSIQYPVAIITPLSSTPTWTTYNNITGEVQFMLDSIEPHSCKTIYITDTVECFSKPYNLPLEFNLKTTPLNNCYPMDTVHNYEYFSRIFLYPIGTTELFKESTLSLYPNPTDHSLFLEIEDNNADHEVLLMDMTGKVLSRNALLANSNKLNIDVSKLSSGMYIILVHNEQGSIRSKFIKR